MFRENSINEQIRQKLKTLNLKKKFRENPKNKQILPKKVKTENSEFSGKIQKINKFTYRCVNAKMRFVLFRRRGTEAVWQKLLSLADSANSNAIF